MKIPPRKLMTRLTKRSLNPRTNLASTLLKLSILCSLALSGCAVAPSSRLTISSPATQTIRLWPTTAPGALGDSSADIPTLTIYRPKIIASTHAAMIICPGGGYYYCAPNEIKPPANWLNSLGITAFVLRYRLGPTYRYPIPLEDVQRAIRLVRSRAVEFDIDPDRVGVIGFSAGGHLAAGAATAFDLGNPRALDTVDRSSSRPDLAMLVYPVITMKLCYGKTRSREFLLGKNPSPELIERASIEDHVSPQTPPCFIIQAADDRVISPSNSLLMATACFGSKVPFELHIYPRGGHGFDVGSRDPLMKPWLTLASAWFTRYGFLRK
jgi:acetyl esterase/lipase